MRKGIFILSVLLSFSLTAQQTEQPKSQKSRLDGIEKLYKFSKSELNLLDSIKAPTINTVDILPTTAKKITVKDNLILSQVTIPIEAQIVVDSLGGYNEVVTYRTITTVISEQHEKGSFKAYADKLKEQKAKIAARLRKQAEDIEKEN